MDDKTQHVVRNGKDHLDVPSPSNPCATEASVAVSLRNTGALMALFNDPPENSCRAVNRPAI